MAGDDSQGDAGTADTGRFPRPGSDPGTDAGSGANDEVEVTGKFTAQDFKAVEETTVRPVPADEPPPSMGIIRTGAFPVFPKEPAPPGPEEDPRAAATIESTRIEAPPEGAREARDAHLKRAHAVTEPTLEKTLDPAYQPTQPPRRSGASSHRPLDPPPDDPTRPLSVPPPVQPAEGGVLLPLLFAAACLVGIAFLVKNAFPELFSRFTGGAAPSCAWRSRAAAGSTARSSWPARSSTRPAPRRWPGRSRPRRTSPASRA